MIQKIISMRFIRYINLFEKLCGVSTTNCFVYNNIIIFAISRSKISKAIGKGGVNIKKLGETLGKKIRVIEMPEDLSGMKSFVGDIVKPVSFAKFEFRNNVVTINAGRQSKAALIGRGRIRQKELEDILVRSFGVRKLMIV